MGVFFMFSIITVLICPAFILHRAFPRVFKHEICAQSEPYSHREYNLAMRNKSLSYTMLHWSIVTHS